MEYMGNMVVSYNDTVTYWQCWFVAVYEQARAMAVDNIGRMRNRVPSYDWSACNTLRRLMKTLSVLQSNFLQSITIFNTREMYVCHTIYHTLVLLPYYHANLPYYLPHTFELLPYYQTNLSYLLPHTCTVNTFLSD